jgi:hypothetical protein
MRTLIRLIVISVSVAGVVALGGCGATGGPGGGSSNLPVSGGGPFTVIGSQSNDVIDAPVVLTDPAIDLDDPDLFADGDALTLWVTAHRSTGDDIERADSKGLREGFGDLEKALVADQAWEGGSVSAPSVVPGKPMLLFYQGAGGIGYATSDDGHTWTKAPGPILPSLGPPAAVRIGGKIRVYYPKDGGLSASDAPLSELSSFTDLGPLVDGVPFGSALGRAFARSAKTPAGRIRHDLYFTVETGNPTVPTTCGYAASFDGSEFQVESTAIVDPKQITRGPSMAPYGARALLFWTERHGARAAIIAGTSP